MTTTVGVITPSEGLREDLPTWTISCSSFLASPIQFFCAYGGDISGVSRPCCTRLDVKAPV